MNIPMNLIYKATKLKLVELKEFKPNVFGCSPYAVVPM